MMKCILVLLLAVSGLTHAEKTRIRPTALIYADRVPAPYRAAFLSEVTAMSGRLNMKPEWFMVCICFETSCTFRADIRNRYSGAVGLIQFIPTTARRLGTTNRRLADMTPVEQLFWVEQYFLPYRGRIHSVYDAYIVIFAPAFLGYPDDRVLYESNGRTALDRRRYRYNKILDTNKDGMITIKDVKGQIKRFVPMSMKNP